MMRIQKTVLMKTNMILMILSLTMRSWYVVLGSKFHKQILRTCVNYVIFAYDEGTLLFCLVDLLLTLLCNNLYSHHS